MAKKTLGESVHGKLPASTVLAAPWPYLLAGILILAIAAWARVGVNADVREREAAMDQGRMVVRELARPAAEIHEMLRSPGVQERAEALSNREVLSSELLREMRRLIPEVTDVHVYGNEVFMTDLDAMGGSGFVMLDMMATALDDQISPVQLIQDQGLSYLAAAATIGRAVQGKGFVVAYLDPSFLLNRFNVASPAAGYLGLEHSTGANAPVRLKEIGRIPAGYELERVPVSGSLLRVVVPQNRADRMLGGLQQNVLLLVGVLLLLFALVRFSQLRRSAAAASESAPDLRDFEPTRSGDQLPPTLAGGRTLQMERRLAGKSPDEEPMSKRAKSRVRRARPTIPTTPPRPEPDPPLMGPGERRLTLPNLDVDSTQTSSDAPATEVPASPLADAVSEPGPGAPEDNAPAVPRIGQPAVALDLGPGSADAAVSPETSPPQVATKEPSVQEHQVLLSSEIFRAYDIRGVVGETLDREVARQIGLAVGSLALDSLATPVVVGRDGRHSGPDLVAGLAEGIAAAGCDVIDIGAVPTGALYYSAYELGQGSGVMVTGSHNPPEYNGLKIMIGGRTLAGDNIYGLYERIRSGNLRSGAGKLSQREMLTAYQARIAGDVKLARPLRIVADAGNGIGGSCMGDILRAVGAEVITLYEEVDGDFPNHHPDPSEPKNLTDLIHAVKHTGAELGVAFDGDADRLGVVTPDGEIIFSDRLMMLFIREILSRHPGQTIIYDVKCTGHLHGIIEAAGGVPEMYKTGHSLIKNRMKEVDAPFAGEMSGHFFFKDRWYGFDCGIYSACRLLELLAREEGKPVDVLAALPNSVSTPELKVHMREGENHDFIAQFQKSASFPGARINTIDGVRADFADSWGLVRASNTTPILVLRFDADSEDALRRVQAAFRAQLLAVRDDLELPF